MSAIDDIILQMKILTNKITVFRSTISSDMSTESQARINYDEYLRDLVQGLQDQISSIDVTNNTAGIMDVINAVSTAIDSHQLVLSPQATIRAIKRIAPLNGGTVNITEDANNIFIHGEGNGISRQRIVRYTESATLKLSDANCIIECDSVNPIVLTVPHYDDVPFKSAVLFDVVQINTGGVQVVGADDVTIEASGDGLGGIDTSGLLYLSTEPNRFIFSIAGGSGVPDGGTAGQALLKQSGDDGDATWQTLTKGMVGLSNVDNIAAVDMPVSTAQAAADTDVLNTAKTYADNLVVGLFDFRGSYDASTGLFPTVGGSGSGGAVLKGDIWRISVAGTIGGVALRVGDSIYAAIDTPAQVVGNWGTILLELGYNPEDVANKVTAFSAPTNTQYPSAKLVKDQLDLKEPVITGGTVSQFWNGLKTWVNYYFTQATAAALPTYTTTNVSLSPIGAATDIGISLVPKGLGYLSLGVPDNTTVGGNKRSSNSVDLQMVRSSAGQVAGGTANNVISGGSNNAISVGTNAVIGGGLGNSSSSNYATVGGGNANQASGDNATISGGASNIINSSGLNATIGGGNGNSITNTQATIGGGTSNTATQQLATIGGGASNTAGEWAVVAGGVQNNSGRRGFIGGGVYNVVSGDLAVVCGGGNTGSGSADGNKAQSYYGAILGGRNNVISAPSDYSAILAGRSNSATAMYTTVLGSYGAATQTGEMVLGSAAFATTGVAQHSTLMLALGVAGAASTDYKLTSNAGAASAINQLALPTNTFVSFEGLLIITTTTAGTVAAFSIQGAAYRAGGNVTIKGTPTITALDAGSLPAGWAVTAVADTTNQSVAIVLNMGASPSTIRALCTLRVNKLTY